MSLDMCCGLGGPCTIRSRVQGGLPGTGSDVCDVLCPGVRTRKGARLAPVL